MADEIYILYGCYTRAGQDNMVIQGVTTSEATLYSMIADKIKAGEMGYGNMTGEDAFQLYAQDFGHDMVSFRNLQHGCVKAFTDIQLDESLSPKLAEVYAELTDAKAGQMVAALGLMNRSLTYSMVEVFANHHSVEFLTAGICDQAVLEESDQYRELMEDADETTVYVNVVVCSVGRGESEYPDEDELEVLEQYQEKIDAEYGIDQIQQDAFSFEFEPEEEF